MIAPCFLKQQKDLNNFQICGFAALGRFVLVNISLASSVFGQDLQEEQD